jgi:hypothetical protein
MDRQKHLQWKEPNEVLDDNASNQIVAPSETHSILPLAEVPAVRFALLVSALWSLAKFDVLAIFGGFAAVHDRVNRCHLAATRLTECMIDDVCAAVNRACGYYPKNAACLQRSAAVVWLLRGYGVPADLVIGVNKFPFKSHAWVEVEGRVVNDRQRVREVYVMLDRWSATTNP